MPPHPTILKANEVRNRDLPKAAEMVEELILKGDPAAPGGGAYDLLGQIYLSMGDISSARDSFLKNLDVYPDSEGTFCYLGLIEKLAGNSSKAKEWYSRCPGRDFDSSYVSKVQTAFRKFKVDNQPPVNRIALITSGTRPPSLGEKTSKQQRAEPVEKCPKCGRQEPRLTAVVDYPSMSQKLLCSQCARATMKPESFYVNSKKWWQFWKK